MPDQTKFAALESQEWATLTECAHWFSQQPKALPADSIRRLLVERIARDEIAIRFDGEPWTRDNLLTTITGVHVTADHCDERLARAKEAGNDAQAARWVAMKEAATNYSLLTFDALPQHIEPRPTPDGKCARSKLELFVSDVLIPSKRVRARRRDHDSEAKRLKNIKDAVAYARQANAKPPRPSIKQMALNAVRQKKNFDFSFETLRQIYSGRYKLMREHGIPGIDG